MSEIIDINRPSKDLISSLEGLGSATASGELHKLGIRDPYIQGPRTFTRGKSIVGPALTLQFFPLREDIYQDGEYSDPEEQLHRKVLYAAKP